MVTGVIAHIGIERDEKYEYRGIRKSKYTWEKWQKAIFPENM